MIVLDSSALLAFLFEETGADRVADELDRATLSAVQHAEVISKLTSRGMPWQKACELLATLALPIVPVTRPLSEEGARLHGVCRPYGLSLADALCLATASDLKAPVLTADRAWSRVTEVAAVSVVQIRPET